MPIFSFKGNKLIPIKEERMDLEKDLQRLVENNLQTLFELEFVSSEFNIENFWLDSIAFDPTNKSFVVIEYKKVENFSLMDQGQTYLNLLLDHKAEVILEYNEKLKKQLKRADINWGQTRVVFIGPRFNTYQKRALHPNLPFELWEVSNFEGGIISFYPVLPISTKTQNAKPALIGKAATEIKTFSIDDYKEKTSEELNGVFENLRSKILELDPTIKEKATSWYVGYSYHGYLIAYLKFYKERLAVHIPIEKPVDPKSQLVRAPKSWQGWSKTPLWRFQLTTQEQIPYLITLIEQSYRMRGH